VPNAIRRRTAGDLLTLAHVRAQERTRLLDAKRAAEVARRKAEDEANRARYLDQRGKCEEATWNQIEAHIQKRQPNEYDKAVTLLTDLRDLMVRQDRVTAFQSALEELRRTHPAKESFLRRLTKAKL
jgi:membrane protein involved in colicin uptake